MPRRPLTVAVVIPLYNAEPFIRETLDSVMAQTRRPDQVLVVDDGSTDDGPRIAARYPVTVIRSQGNAGVSSARNLGAAATSADAIALLDSDDVWLPAHLETTVALLERHPEAGVAFGRVRLFGDVSWEQEMRIPPEEPVDAYWEQYHENLVIPSSSVIRHDVLREVGGFNPANRTGNEDFEFFLAATERHRLVMSRQITVRYRKHGGQTTTATKPRNRRGEYDVRVRLLDEARRTRPAAFVRQMEAAMLRSWEARLQEAWSSRSTFWMRFYLDLHALVPHSARVHARWRRRAALLPAARLADRVRRVQSPWTSPG